MVGHSHRLLEDNDQADKDVFKKVSVSLGGGGMNTKARENSSGLRESSE